MRTLHCLTIGIALAPLTAHSHRPLFTDDTGTADRGGYEVELGVSRTSDRDSGAFERVYEYDAQLTYGARDNLDLSLELPWTRQRTDDGAATTNAHGIGDAALSLKWRFWESGAASMALKPNISLPTGNEAEDLGAGRVGYGIDAIASVVAEPWNFHFQLGYFRNSNELDERADLRSASFAVVRDLSERAKLAFDFGVATNTDKSDDNSRVFVLAGFIYALTPAVTADIGYKKGISDPEVDRELTFGVTIDF